jgi:hypothetical protein
MVQAHDFAPPIGMRFSRRKAPGNGNARPEIVVCGSSHNDAITPPTGCMRRASTTCRSHVELDPKVAIRNAIVTSDNPDYRRLLKQDLGGSENRVATGTANCNVLV